MSTSILERPSSRAAASLADDFLRVRAVTEKLCEPLEIEDYVVQSMPDCSPTKWHLAHVSWFFETFILGPHVPGYTSLHPQYTYLFNSYYNAIGERHCRPKRGLISRPTVKDTYRYRAYVDAHMLDLLGNADDGLLERITPLLVLGLHHEQQHQELLVTDLKHALAENPLHPVYVPREPARPSVAPAQRWIDFAGGLTWIGHAGEGFAFDNEGPRHQQFVQPFKLASRPVTNGEYLEFMAADGYQRPELWLSAGWATSQDGGLHLVSLIAQVVRVADVDIPFERGESIWTEASYKYNQDEFADLVAGAGWRVEEMWTDDRSLFSVEYLVHN